MRECRRIWWRRKTQSTLRPRARDWKTSLRGPKEHINRSISHSGSSAQYIGDTRKRGRILTFMWSFGSLPLPFLKLFMCYPASLLTPCSILVGSVLSPLILQREYHGYTGIPGPSLGDMRGDSGLLGSDLHMSSRQP